MFTILLLGSVLSVFLQEQKVYFDDAIAEHLKSYNKKCDLALQMQDAGYVDILFDSLKNTYLKGTLIPKFKFKKISGGYLDTDRINTPILLITKKSCILTNREEIKAINEVANRYKGKLEVIILYWDKKRSAKKSSKGFNKNISLVYVNERDNKLDANLSSIKNSFGVPASFYITENKELSNIDRKFYLKNLKKDTKRLFVETIYKDITRLLLENETQKKENNYSTRDN